MKHVFVETNWVVEYGAPEHVRPPKAMELVERAEDGKLRLYLPSICLTEARHPIRKKFKPRATSDALRSYLALASKQGTLKAGDSEAVRRILDKYEGTVLAELDNLDDRMEWLRDHPAIEVFALSEKMLARAVELSFQNLDLKPFDQAILAAVLVRAQELCDSGADDIAFCELDGDLQPWDKDGRAKEPLYTLYTEARVLVYGDFAMETPAKIPSSPHL
jgi:predicted nucleic acid-binding protein